MSAAVGKSSVHGTVAGSPYTVADDEKIMALHLFIHSFTGRMEDTRQWTRAGTIRGKSTGTGKNKAL